MTDTSLVLIRHGETPWNTSGRLQGSIDIELSERGLWQAQRVADRLRQEPIAAVISSDLVRAAQTAAPLAAARGLELRASDVLRPVQQLSLQIREVDDVEVHEA